jgi:hypothetical protein
MDIFDEEILKFAVPISSAFNLIESEFKNEINLEEEDFPEAIKQEIERLRKSYGQ